MARYIDVEKVHIPKGFFKDLNVPKLLDWLKSQPTADVVEVVRCKDCEHSRKLEKNCEINNREHYRHCAMYRGEEERVWVKYKRYYKDYSIVELDDYCSYGERKCNDD